MPIRIKGANAKKFFKLVLKDKRTKKDKEEMTKIVQDAIDK